MENLDVLARDFGLGGRGKSNPMRSDAGERRFSSVHSTSSSSPFFDDHSNHDSVLFSDMFGAPPKYNSTSAINHKSASVNEFDYDSIFKSSSTAKDSKSSKENTGTTSSFPVYDKPVYDDDMFGGLPGRISKSPSTGRVDDDVFVSMALQSEQRKNSTADHFDDLLGKLAKNDRSDIKNLNSEGFDDLLGNFKTNESVVDRRSSSRSSSARGLDDLLGGFGGGSSVGANRSASDSNHGQKPAGVTSQSTSRMMDDPFVVLETTSPPVSSSEAAFTDPLEEIGKLGKSRNGETDTSFVSGGVFDDLDPLNSGRRSAVTSVSSNGGNDMSPSRSGPSISGPQTPANSEHVGKPSFDKSNSHSQMKMPDDNFQESPIFDIPATDYRRSFHTNPSSPLHVNANNNETNFPGGMPPRSEEHLHPSDDIWLSVSEIPLFTQPIRTPPPSRPPPPIPRRNTESEPSFSPSDLRKRGDDFASPPAYTSYSQIPKRGRPAANSTSVSQIDELEDFAMGTTKNTVDEDQTPSWEEINASSIAADAMKEAMDRAEAKFRHAKEVREREYAKAAKTKEAVHVDQDDEAFQEAQEREFHENQDRLERERRQREEEEEREQRRLERERERAREIEREKGRQAVERATREARVRAAAEARVKAERAAVGKVQNEARERAERAAVLRVQAEARERAAAEARERQEKAAAEARERVTAEAREKEVREKAAAEKAAAEARRRAERAAAEARQRAAVEAQERAARANQQKNENDVESFFKMDSRANSAPRSRGNSSDSIFDAPPSRGSGGSQGPKPTHAGSPSNMPKAFSTTNIVDDLSSIFQVDAQSGQFQAVEGENEERTKAIWERNKRTQERAAKALAEKNQRDLQAQREQEERHRIAETLDIEIKRWAAGKEGNIRALLSTLQYVLWPECGWLPVSLTDLIIGSNVKKVYRKATLCIHPDKVQQKGATLQQKYISEKVFDLLKEAWNKFNSEELF